MKNLYLLCLIALLPLGAFAQRQNGLTLSGGWNYSYRHFNAAYYENTSRDSEGNLRRSDLGTVNFRVGLHYHSALKERLFLQLGLGFSRIGISNHPAYYIPQGFHQSRFRRTVSSIDELNREEEFITKRQFFNFPVNLRFMGKPRPWTPYIEGGFIFQYYLNTRYSYDNGTEKSFYFYENRRGQFIPLQLCTKVAVGTQYQWLKRMHAFIQLEFRYHLTPLYQTQIKEHLYNGGIEVGLRYGLSRSKKSIES